MEGWGAEIEGGLGGGREGSETVGEAERRLSTERKGRGLSGRAGGEDREERTEKGGRGLGEG